MRFLLPAAVKLSCMPAAARAAPDLPLLPLPAVVAPQAGSFLFSRATIAANDAGGVAAAHRLAELVARSGGPRLVLARGGTIRCRRDAAVKGAEAYRLRITPAGATVTASA